MPSFNLYKKMLCPKSNETLGNIHKIQSDKVMDYTWWNDINAQVGYLYDWYHDSTPTLLRNLNPQEDKNKIPIDVKYLRASSKTYDKDTTTFRIQLRPNQECNVDYYNECFKDRYQSIFPCGLYIDLMDNNGKYNRWLVVGEADFYDPQWSTFEVLPCDYVFQYMMNGMKKQVAGVLRSQNSYNSGIWTNYKETTQEDQQKFVIPLNRETEKIFHDLRMIIDAGVLTEPVTWQITKIHRLAPNGLVSGTLAQTKFNDNTDFIELDNNGNVIGMWADFYTQIPQTPIDTSTNYAVITYSGLKPQVKVGGSYKKFTVTFFNENKEPITFENGTWSFKIKRNPNTPDEVIEDCSEIIKVLDNTTSTDLEENQIKLRFDGGTEYLGDILIISYTSISDIYTDVEMEIIGL